MTLNTLRPKMMHVDDYEDGAGRRGTAGGGASERKLDEEMQQLINIQSRTELEMVFGVPPPVSRPMYHSRRLI